MAREKKTDYAYVYDIRKQKDLPEETLAAEDKEMKPKVEKSPEIRDPRMAAGFQKYSIPDAYQERE